MVHSNAVYGVYDVNYVLVLYRQRCYVRPPEQRKS